ncbi:MAG: GDSL-type esterase/lipase family protein, partial [Chloroflexota bacterium]
MGWFLILLGLVLNRWVIGWLFGDDGAIESIAFNAAIIVLQLGLIGAGVLVLRYPKSLVASILTNTVVMGLTTLITIFAVDQGLGLLNFPTELIPPVTHPPNYAYHVENIEYKYVFQTNSMGIRYREIPLEKPENTVRVVVVGDSFTEGAGVTSSETFLAVAEQQLSTEKRSVELINCALSGTAALQQSRALFQVCLQYDPDLVLLSLHGNDVADTPLGTHAGQIEGEQDKRVGIPGIFHALWPRLVVMWETIQLGQQQARVAVGSLQSEPEILESGSREEPQTTEFNADEIWAKVDLSGNPVENSDMLQAVIEEAQRQNRPQAEIDAWVASLPPDLVAAANGG